MTADASTVTHWAALGACSGHAHPDLWFPEGRSAQTLAQVAEAKAVCAGCPVLTDCLVDALRTRERWGTRGGAGPDRRRRILARALTACTHDPLEACADPACSWCPTLAAHRRSLVAASVPGSAVLVAFTDKATHGRRSTYVRGCRCSACVLAASCNTAVDNIRGARRRTRRTA